MAWVERRVTRMTQPQDSVGIDWSNPLAKGLKLLYSDGTELVSRSIGAKFSTEKIVTQKGLGLKLTATSGRVQFSSDVAVGLLSEITLLQYGRIELTTVDATAISKSPSNGASTTPFDFGIAGGGGIKLGRANSGFKVWRSAATIQENTDFIAFAVQSGDIGSAPKFYINGSFDTASAISLYGGTGTGAATEGGSLRVLNRGDGAPFWNGGAIYLCCAWDRQLTATEIKSLSDNPWQIFEPEVERIWISDYIATGGLTQVQSDASLNYVLQAITFNSQGGMYSILGLVNSDINASYNVTEAAVNSTSASYVIQSAVQQSQNEEYNVLAALSSTQGSTYNVRSALTQDQGSTYFISESTYREQLVDYVIRSQQHNDQSATYSILSANSVGNNADLNYVISALIQQDQQENYLVRSSAHQETNGVYTVRSSADSTTEGSYAVRASLTGDATLDYSIRAEVNSSGSMSYTVRASLSKDQGLLYDILAASNVQASSSASYVIQATTANNTTCSYQIQGEVIDLPLTNAEMQQLYAWVGELVTKSATKEEIATAVWSKPQSELTVENSIGKWLMQKVLTVSKFLALK